MCSRDGIWLDVETFEPELDGRLSRAVVPEYIFNREDPDIPTSEYLAKLDNDTMSPAVRGTDGERTFALLHGSLSFLPIAFILARASAMSCIIDLFSMLQF